jgi:hypothetical protein
MTLGPGLPYDHNGGHMAEQGQSIEERLQGAQVGDTVELTVDRTSLSAEERDRVAPVISDEAGGSPTFQGFTKSAGGEWDLERVRGPKDSPTLDIIVRRRYIDRSGGSVEKRPST